MVRHMMLVGPFFLHCSEIYAHTAHRDWRVDGSCAEMSNGCVPRARDMATGDYQAQRKSLPSRA